MLSPNPRAVLIGLAVVLALAAIAHVALCMRRHEGFFVGVEQEVARGRGVTVLLVHAKWCPHCTAYMKSGALDKTFKSGGLGAALGVRVEHLDYDQEKPRADGYGVHSFPSILAIDTATGAKISEFRGDRYDPAQLVDFARKALSAAR